MTFIPSLITATSTSLQQQRTRTLALYRDFIKNSARMVDDYYLDISPTAVRNKIRQEFEKHRYVKDFSVIDILLFKGRLEYEETMNMWKQKTHVMRYFSQEEDGVYENNDFLSKFYSGKE